jgi:hypothetical protein
VRYTSAEVGDVQAAIVDEIVAEEAYPQKKDQTRKFGKNQRLVLRIVRNFVIDAEGYFPYGAEGPCVKAVREAAIREEFIKKQAGEDPAQRTSKAKRFTEALQSLLDNEVLVRSENAKAEGMIWMGSKRDEQTPFEEADDEA